jgi:hypothetical protein
MTIHLKVAIEELHRAARAVLRGNPAAGADGMTTSTFRVGLEDRLRRIWRQLRSGRYEPGRLRSLYIERHGKTCLLEIPRLQDRVVCRVLLDRVFPLLEQSVAGVGGHRLRSGTRVAISEIGRARATHRWAARADLQDAYRSLDLGRALGQLARRCHSDETLLAVATMMRAARPSGRGLPVGHPLSPLLLNVYLSDVDHALLGPGIPTWRYVDDFLFLGEDHDQVAEALAVLERLLARKGMALATGKTEVVSPEESAVFLGWEVQPGGAIRVSEAAVEAVLRGVAELRPAEVVQRLGGWLSHFGDAADSRIEEVIRIYKAALRASVPLTTTSTPSTSTSPSVSAKATTPSPQAGTAVRALTARQARIPIPTAAAAPAWPRPAAAAPAALSPSSIRTWSSTLEGREHGSRPSRRGGFQRWKDDPADQSRGTAARRP